MTVNRGHYTTGYRLEQLGDELAAALKRAEVAEAQLAERAKDTERLDWLESAKDLNAIESGGSFPDGKWTIWRDDTHGHWGRGLTLREAIDAATAVAETERAG